MINHLKYLFRNMGFVLAATLVLSACGDGATAKLAEQIKTSHTLNGKKVEMVGYLKTNKFTFVRNGLASVILVPSTWSAADQDTALLSDVMLKFGKEANSIYMPEKYTGNQVEFRDSSGEVYGVNTKFKITGVVQYDSIEKIVEPKMPSGPFVLPSAKESYAKAKAVYDERVKKGDVYDYKYKVVDVVFTAI